jgi:predicted branched-subunit amino acid permease
MTMQPPASPGRPPDQGSRPRRWPEDRPAWSWPEAARVAGKDLVPAVVALAPLGLVVGVTVQQTRLGALLGVASAPAIFAGTAQLSALTLLHSGAGVVAVVGSVAVINARMLVYAAALEPRFRGQPQWFRWFAPHFVVDPTFALATARDDLAGPVTFRRYWLAMGCMLTVAWSGLVGLGVAAGPAFSGAGHVLAFAPVAVFLAMLAPRLTARPALVAAGVAGVVTGSLAFGGGLPTGAPVLIGAAAGVAAAVLACRRPS